MSLVMAAMEMSPLMWRVSPSTSWVWPAPTAPPMPILMGSLIFPPLGPRAPSAHEHPGTLAFVPHLRNFQSGADGPEVVGGEAADVVDGGSDVVVRFPQHPLPGVLAERDGADG